jgi:hypothetical protein
MPDPAVTTPAATRANGHVAADGAVRQFQVGFSDEAVDDRRPRVLAKRRHEKEAVSDQSQGAALATMQEFARYWAADYDSRKYEARLNAMSQFITEIDGLDVHFIHVRCKPEDALPTAPEPWSAARIWRDAGLAGNPRRGTRGFPGRESPGQVRPSISARCSAGGASDLHIGPGGRSL